jgi:hypothetical protein
MKASELRKLIREEAKRVLKEVEGSTIYQYNFTLSRGLFFDGQDEVSEGEMMAFIKEMWKEQGPSGYDMMQIYASKNTETKDPVVAVELEDALVLYSKIQLNDSVAMSTIKTAYDGKVIKPTQVLAVLNKGKIKEDIIKVFSLAKPYTKPDANQLRVKADNFIKKLQAKNFTTHTGADVIYFPEYKSLGPCFGVLVGSSTVVIQPIDSDKVFKVGEGLLANVMKSGWVDGYLLLKR